MNRSSLTTIRINRFEGPLDLLLHLIQTHQLDVSTVSLTQITNHYLNWVLLMHSFDLDLASEFLIMACTLLAWKSKALLPKEEGPQEIATETKALGSPEALLKQLLEHQKFLQAGARLAQASLLGQDVFERKNAAPPNIKIWKTMDITSLALSFQEILVRSRKRKTILKKETVSLSDKIKDFAKFLTQYKLKAFETLLFLDASRSEQVATFLAALELSRLKKLRLHQEGPLLPLFLELLENLEGFDLSLASGFEKELESRVELR